MKTLYLLSFLILQSSLIASDTPKVLLINAHPDDESGCAATVYKITKEMNGIVDLAVITNGEAGYKYSTLAESIYGIELTEEKIGRKYLPDIRKKELKAGGSWVGIRNYIFFDQLDTYYTLDADTVLRLVWDTAFVTKSLRSLIQNEHYDYIFCLLPTPQTHGHHKAATILALETVRQLPLALRPTILGVSGAMNKDTLTNSFLGLPAYPITKIEKDAPIFTFNRKTPFGYNGKLNYNIVVNWLIAEHKSQCTMQTFMNQGDKEVFYFFAINNDEKKERTKDLFSRMTVPIFTKKTYK
ncbi:MAG: PIG-L family deacetylase [Candidatus Kapabacteria bacterium]|nr:PIG-L family deacetylase [Candidatus Kapabacteria bacterium]